MREPIPATRHLGVFETLKEAWHLTKGSKWAIWAPLLALMGFCIAGGLLFALLTHLFQSKAFAVSGAVVLVVGLLILMAGFFSGILKITIERARGNSVSSSSGFHSFSRVLPVLLTLILLGIIIELPQIIQLILGFRPSSIEMALIVLGLTLLYCIILSAFLYLATLLAIDQTNSPFTAIGHSIKACAPHWLKIIGIVVMTYLIMIVLYIPYILGVVYQHNLLLILGGIFMLVAFIWAVPFLLLVQGVVYHKLVD